MLAYNRILSRCAIASGGAALRSTKSNVTSCLIKDTLCLTIHHMCSRRLLTSVPQRPHRIHPSIQYSPERVAAVSEIKSGRDPAELLLHLLNRGLLTRPTATECLQAFNYDLSLLPRKTAQKKIAEMRIGEIVLYWPREEIQKKSKKRGYTGWSGMLT